MKLPNGYGCVRKLGGHRRKPYAVLLTTDWETEADGSFRQRRQYLSYHKTKDEALQALANYHSNPFDLDAAKATFIELYRQWARQMGESLPAYARFAVKHLAPIHDMKLRDIRHRHLQALIDASELSRSGKGAMKAVCNKVFQHAIDAEMLTANPAGRLKVPQDPPSDMHKAFTDEELETLWQHTDDLGARVMLTLCYTGMRSVELCLVRAENVHLDERYMVGGAKTDAGRNRVIPIHRRILPFIEEWLADGGEWLFTPGAGKGVDRESRKGKTYLSQSVWHICNASPALRALPLRHLPHDGRHTCVTRLNNADVNHHTIMTIVGHKHGDITDRVYTHTTIAQLVAAIDRL